MPDRLRRPPTAIMLSRVKMTFAELRTLILNANTETLSEQLLRQLLQYIPTAEEQALLVENLDQHDQLDKAEQFYIEVGDEDA